MTEIEKNGDKYESVTYCPKCGGKLFDDCCINCGFLLNGNKVYVYISKSPVIQHNFQFKQDVKVAKCLNEKLKEFYK